MISALRLCPKCGAEIPADAPEGGCPGCLLESGLRLLDEEARVPQARDDPGRPDEPTRAATRSERLLLGCQRSELRLIYRFVGSDLRDDWLGTCCASKRVRVSGFIEGMFIPTPTSVRIPSSIPSTDGISRIKPMTTTGGPMRNFLRRLNAPWPQVRQSGSVGGGGGESGAFIEGSLPENTAR